MPKLTWAFAVLLFCLLIPTGAFQESVELLRLSNFNPTHNDLLLAVSLTNEDLNGVASSVLAAENWVKTHVLSHYPAYKITHIVVGHNVLCAHNRQDEFGLILPAVKNLYYSLTWWGLERDIKVSPSVSSQCLVPHSSAYRADMADNLFKPLLGFLQRTNSTYLLNPPYAISKMSEELDGLVSSHLISMRKFGSFDVSHIKVIIPEDHDQEQTKPTSRKLSFFVTKTSDPYPARPTPLPELSPSSSVHLSSPAHIIISPLPPQIGTISPPPSSLPPLVGSTSPSPSSLPPLVGSASPLPPLVGSPSPPLSSLPPLVGSTSPPPSSLPPLGGSTSPPPFSLPPLGGSTSPPPFSLPPLGGSTSPPPFSLPPQSGSSSPPLAPKESPVIFPAPPPLGGIHLPPCNPPPAGSSRGGRVAAPEPGTVVSGERLWCVAKPSVPAETLQEALDFACGAGGADCAEIQPKGNCYNPDTVVAHASYAFNSYWQRTKKNGGTCNFGGTAMIINADPSFVNCKFIVS